MLYAGLSPPAGPAELQPLSSAGLTPAALAAMLYPELAASAARQDAVGGEAADALEALAAHLAPMLAVCTYRATRPAHAKGVAFSLKSRAAVAAPSPPVPAPAAELPRNKPRPDAAAAAAAWSALAPMGDANGTGSNGAGHGSALELMDEDDLLEEEDLAKKEAQQYDCGTSDGGKRKACKNCSCGLREMLENEDSNAPPPSKSACGNCSRGDAFRCAGCPHLGKPAWEPGEELKLAGDGLQGDAAVGPGSEEKKLVERGGVVKLSLDDTMDDVF